MQIHRLHLILFVLCCSAPFTLRAQTHDISFGAHAGAAFYLTDGDFRNMPGGTVGVEMAYTVRGVIANYTALGIKIGAGVSYANANHSLPNYEEKYTNIDYYPEPMDYTIVSATYREHQHQLQLEAPLFLSFISHGLTINIGGKFMMPFFQRRHIDVTDAHITAYYPDFWVPVTDYLATGRLEDYQYHGKEVSVMPKLNAMLALEVGYEWHSGWQDRMGILAYFDYGIWNNYSNNPPMHRLIDVAPILNTEYPVPDIKVNALTDTYASKANYMSVGVRFYYAFHFEQRKVYPCRCVMD